MNLSTLKLFYEPKDRLRMTIPDDRSYPTVKPVWAAPLSRPGKFLTLLDGKGNEIVLLPTLDDLAPDSREAVLAEVRLRYLTARVQAVTHARQEFGVTYWSVQTDRGLRDFVTQNLQENAVWLSDTHLLLLDVDGNRFEIEDLAQMDPHSRHLVETIV